MKNLTFTALTLALLCATPCLAKNHDVNTSTDAGCPVEITRAGIDHRNQSYTVYADYNNKSTKTITGVKYGLDLMDATNDWSEYAENFASKSHTRPGKGNVRGEDWDVYPDQVSRSRVYIVKVAFDDGTTWEDDGTKKCQFVRDTR